MSLIVQLHPTQLPHQIGYRHGFSAGQRVCASGLDDGSDLRDREYARDIATKKNPATSGGVRCSVIAAARVAAGERKAIQQGRTLL
jgi:hypothetical protein